MNAPVCVRAPLKFLGLGLMFWAAAALAQFPFPGQYPYPGGSPYPGGPYPGGGYPGGQQNPQQQQPQNSRRPRAVSVTTDGMVRRVSGNRLVIQADDYRIVWFRITAQTTAEKNGDKVDVGAFQPGDRVSVDSTQDDDGNLTATDVNWTRAGSPAERAAAQQTWDLPGTEAASGGGRPSGPSSSDYVDDDDRPILRRNKTDADSKPPESQKAPAEQTPPAEQTKDAAPAQNASPAPVANDDDANAPPATQDQPPPPPREADDPGRPVLRRGGPAAAHQPAPPQASANPAPAQPPRAASPARTPNNAPVLTGVSSDTQARPRLPQQAAAANEDPLIAKVREAAFAYSSTLPNFFCQQFTTRYRTENIRQGWQSIDLVSADVAYENGQESYRNIKEGNGTKVRTMDELGGTRSTGEFSSELQDLMSEATGAVFRRDGTDTIRGRSAIVFKLDVPRERSHWRVEAPSQLYYPAYRGSIWVDKETSRVLRIEMQARNLPIEFPFDTVESATDYDFIRLAAAEREFLLPSNAEVLSCERGTSFCSRNRIEFRNYRKFQANSSITFDSN